MTDRGRVKVAHAGEELAKVIPKGTEAVCVEEVERLEMVRQTIKRTQGAYGVRSLGTVLDHLGAGETDAEEWVPLADIFGASVPPDVADLLRDALERMTKAADVTGAAKWRAIELWAAEYLAGA